MTTEEVNAIFSLADINKDGKLDYAEVSLDKYEVTSILTDTVTTLLYIPHLSGYLMCPSLWKSVF